MAIQDSDILHVNAALIAGILILFSLTGLVVEEDVSDYKGWIAATITPFAGSSILLLFPTRSDKTMTVVKAPTSSRIKVNVLPNPRFWTSVGFGFLLITILFLRFG